MAYHAVPEHWARTDNPFYLPIIKSVVSTSQNDWQDEFDTALAEWSASSVLKLVQVAEELDADIRAECPMLEGGMRVCNYNYGYTGWAGVAEYSYYSDGHIAASSAKLNDYYSYSATVRRHLMCHEIGHPLGLGHTSTNGTSQGTCMDYANHDEGSKSPSAHDFDVLEDKYAHLDARSTVGAVPESLRLSATGDGAPKTSSPPTKSPSKSPTTPAPVTPSPTPAAPITPSPNSTPAPITPQPTPASTEKPTPRSPTSTPTTSQTKSPSKSPSSPAPVTPSPNTPAPVTPAPITPSPNSTPVPITPHPTPASTERPTPSLTSMPTEAEGCRSGKKDKCKAGGRGPRDLKKKKEKKIDAADFGLPAQAEQIASDHLFAKYKLVENEVTTVYEVYFATPDDPTRHLRGSSA
jgi:predicted Zn-dependent protease